SIITTSARHTSRTIRPRYRRRSGVQTRCSIPARRCRARAVARTTQRHTTLVSAITLACPSAQRAWGHVRGRQALRVFTIRPPLRARAAASSRGVTVKTTYLALAALLLLVGLGGLALWLRGRGGEPAAQHATPVRAGSSGPVLASPAPAPRADAPREPLPGQGRAVLAQVALP